jgi:3-phosphoinositide dependent protein kinase-1
MLEKSMSSIGSDLWALGVIIYQMICGDFPFKESQEWQTFQQIINVQFTFPEDFDPIARDLVLNLLQKEPLKRLGAGPHGSGRDYKGLKKHPFFDGIDWKNLKNTRPPLKSRIPKAPPAQFGGGAG